VIRRGVEGEDWVNDDQTGGQRDRGCSMSPIVVFSQIVERAWAEVEEKWMTEGSP